jgi:hypothetical protein
VKSFNRLVAIVLGFSSCSVQAVSADFPSPPQSQLKTFALPKDTKSADISPDERFVVTASTQKIAGADSTSNSYSDFVQLWNIKDEHLVGEFSEPSPDTRIFTSSISGNRTYPPDGLRIVRFFPDGKTLLALIGHTIHILQSQDLTEMRNIPLLKPGDIAQTDHGKTRVTGYYLHSAEISPSGNLLAVLWVASPKHGIVQLCDLATGKIVSSWVIPAGWLGYAGSLKWHPSGTLILIPIPNSQPCLYATHQPDVFAFDVKTGDLRFQLTTGLQISNIAVAPDSRILAVQRGCFQLSKGAGRPLEIFDLNTGKRLQNISGRETGVLYSVSISADGSRIIAFTGKVKRKYDWLDATSYGVTVDETFSVWNLVNNDGIVTSQDVPGLRASDLKLSSSGKYAVSTGKAAFVFTLP